MESADQDLRVLLKGSQSNRDLDIENTEDGGPCIEMVNDRPDDFGGGGHCLRSLRILGVILSSKTTVRLEQNGITLVLVLTCTSSVIQCMPGG